MSETGKLIDQQQDAAAGPTSLWDGLQRFAVFPDWLSSARDVDRISQALKAVVPEFSNLGWQLLNCDVGHIRYKQDFWTALYQLTVLKPGDQDETVIKLQGRVFPAGKIPAEKPVVEGQLGQDGWKAVLPDIHLELSAREPELVLAVLGALIDPEEARQLLQASIRADTPDLHDLAIKSCQPKVVRYKPGSRCTVVYHLNYETGLLHSQPWPDLVVAKTYRGEKGKNAYDSMTALWNSPLGQGKIVKVAQPLAYLPDIKVLVQGPVREEQTLKDLMYQAVRNPTPAITASLNSFTRKTAVGLAALHNSQVSMGRAWVWEDQLAEVRIQVERLDEALPEFISAAAPLLDRLNALAAAAPADPLIPAHGSFRPAQVLIDRDTISFIDFDSFCQSEPANDLALYLGTVMTICLTPDQEDEDSAGVKVEAFNPLTRQQRYNFGAELCETFLKEYELHHPLSRQRVILWQALDIFMFVLHGWTKIKVGEIDDINFLLDQFLARSQIVSPQ